MVLPELDCLLSNFVTVLVGGHKLVRHVGEDDGGLVLLRRLVVEDLVLGVEAGSAHLGDASGPGGNHCVFGFAGEGFDPGGVAVNVMHRHLVLVPAAGGLRELTRLVRIQRVSKVVDFDEEVVLLWFCFRGGCGVGFGRGLCRSNTLALTAHVPELGFLRFREVFVHVLDVDERPGNGISGSNGFEPGRFCQETGGGVEVADGGFNTWELVDVVDGFVGGGPGAHVFNVVPHRSNVRHVVEGVEGDAAVQRVEEEGVGVVILGIGSKWDAPQFGFGSLPPLENGVLTDLDFGSAAVVDIDLFAVVDCGVSVIGEFSGAEEVCTVQGRDHVDGPGGCAQGMLEEALLGGGGGGAVRDMEDFGGAPAGGGEVGGALYEAGAGGCACVADV